MTDASKAAPATGAQPPHRATNTDKVFIFDTTLRDGEQCPGATMTFEEKQEVADFLDAMGVDIIEAGFPIASEGDFYAVSEIAKRLKRSVVCGLSRAGELDIDRAGEAVKHAARPRIHTFIATSPVHRKHKLMKSAEEVLEMVHFQVARARNWVPDVEWSAEDATRTEIDYLCRCVETALKAGATTINLPDTVGYATPEEYYQMFRTVMEKVPGSEKAIFSVHCHNDLGMAVANSLAGIRAGCRQIECTINGIGERAGNAALEEVVMAIKTRGDVMPYELGDNALEDAFNRFKALADRKKHVYDEDLEALVDEEIATAQDRMKVVALTVIAGTVGPQSATLTLDMGEGKQQTVQSTGNGPVDATFNAIHKLVPHKAKLALYQVHAVTEGTDAQAEVSVRLEDEAEGGRAVTARAADPDTLVASAKAYLSALNKLFAKRGRLHAQQSA